MKNNVLLIIFLFITSTFALTQDADKNTLYFCIVDEEETRIFTNYYNENPVSTFNEGGELINPNILSSDVIILGVFDGHKQRYNADGNPDFVAVRIGIKLEKSQIKNVDIGKDIFSGRPVVNFFLTPEGGEMFYNLTQKNTGKPMAVALGNQVRLIAIITTPIREAISIQGIDEEEAKEIAGMLKR